MTDHELDNRIKEYFQQFDHLEPDTKHLEETVRACIQIVREQQDIQEIPRLHFWGYLSEIFRYDGLPILGLHSCVLLLICFAVFLISDAPKNLPIFMPLFVLAVMPVIFRGQYYGMSEIEAATRTSGAQIMLVRLILAGASNLICMTALLGFEICRQNSGSGLGQMILYCLVPYLTCMVCILRLIRLKRENAAEISIIVTLSSCVLWGILAKTVPWLYLIQATGIWIIAVALFTAFFIKEILYIVQAGKEGKMYGIIV